ncbi:hypothetical protein P148_SR1C00001G0360 [candidate division SR1 bacterium RAAC1_SR1_1]|nr:hypothetical protein P148_SR1C00001G0360 [candidate division SR1 bacterium RAAC1_SR1_1]
MKKILTFIFAIVSIGVSFATYQSSESRLSPEYKEMNFQATLENNTVAMIWAPFSVPTEHSFVYWKVMRSQNTENPIYREDKSEYITYTAYPGFTGYTDKDPKKGTTRYRICAITKASDGYHRYCSKEVKKITITSTENTYKEEIKKDKPTTELTDAQKATLDTLAADFLKKLEEKFGTDASKKKGVLTKVVLQLNMLGKKQVKIKTMVSYLVSKLEVSIDPLEEIKNILKVE